MNSKFRVTIFPSLRIWKQVKNESKCSFRTYFAFYFLTKENRMIFKANNKIKSEVKCQGPSRYGLELCFIAVDVIRIQNRRRNSEMGQLSLAKSRLEILSWN